MLLLFNNVGVHVAVFYPKMPVLSRKPRFRKRNGFFSSSTFAFSNQIVILLLIWEHLFFAYNTKKLSTVATSLNCELYLLLIISVANDMVRSVSMVCLFFILLFFFIVHAVILISIKRKGNVSLPRYPSAERALEHVCKQTSDKTAHSASTAEGRGQKGFAVVQPRRHDAASRLGAPARPSRAQDMYSP